MTVKHTHTAITWSLVDAPHSRATKHYRFLLQYDFQLISSITVKELLYVNWLKLREKIIISPQDTFGLILSDDCLNCWDFVLSFYASVVMIFVRIKSQGQIIGMNSQEVCRLNTFIFWMTWQVVNHWAVTQKKRYANNIKCGESLNTFHGSRYFGLRPK